MDKKIEVPVSISDAIYNTTEKETTILTDKEIQDTQDRYDLSEQIVEYILNWLKELGDKRIGFWNTFKLVTGIISIIKAKKK